ncbi:MAG: hypothetical protein GKR87_06085 [Kiritimatiellae bacterium]|nr:hypothetical protein [Kiritimatiellia bacterium]
MQFRDLDNEICWLSTTTDISVAASINIDLVVSNNAGNFDPGDFISVGYMVDGVEVTNTFLDDVDLDASTSSNINITGISGTSLVLKVCFLNNAGAERYYLDVVLLQTPRI